MRDLIQVVLVDPGEESRPALQQSLRNVRMAWLAAVCVDYKSAARRVGEVSADLAIVVLDSDPEQAIGLIEAIGQYSPDTEILPASGVRDSSLILRVMRAGAREFLTLPAQENELSEVVGRLFCQRKERAAKGTRGPQVIAVTGATGGVGCTTLAINLAATLAKTSGQETILADFDLFFGAVDASLDVIPTHTLTDVLQNIDRLDLTLLKRSLTRHASGLYVLPRPVALEDATRVDPEMLARVLTMLRAAFPSVVIDTSKGLHASDCVAFEAADTILVVIQLDLICMRNTTRLLDYFRQSEGMIERVRLVVNRTLGGGEDISIKKAEETLKLPISWDIPNATKIFRPAQAKGVPIDMVASGSRPHQAILEIAKAHLPFPKSEPVKPRRGIFAALF